MIEPINITPSTSSLGATVTNVSLPRLTDEEWEKVREAFLQHAVLIFPNQHLSSAEQMSFGSRFGELSIEYLAFSNENDDGSVRKESDALVQLFKGNEGWHTDSSFQPVSAKASILSAHKVPSRGGQTQWLDMRAAYDQLPDNGKASLEGLNARHSLYHSQSKIGSKSAATAAGLSELHRHDQPRPKDRSAGYSDMSKPPLRPLVKVHPETSRKALFIGRHAFDVTGLTQDESEAMLQQLLDFADVPARMLSHSWKVGDVVIWDNRCVLHRSRPWPAEESRVMHHTRVAGDPATETALNYR